MPEHSCPSSKHIMLLMGISPEQPKYLAAFRLQLKGPALTWYISLEDSNLGLTWNHVREKFIAEFDQTLSGLKVVLSGKGHCRAYLKTDQAIPALKQSTVVARQSGKKVNGMLRQFSVVSAIFLFQQECCY